MVATPSTMLELGSIAPDFSLTDTTNGRSLSLADFADFKVKVIMFICNHCPYVIHLAEALRDIPKEFSNQSVAFIAINANDTDKYPDDSPEKMREEKEKRGYIFPYLFDETQEVAKAYKAACTPDFFVFDKQNRLTYRGQFDDSRPGNGKPVTGKDLREAIKATLTGQSPIDPQKPSIGCNIKWRPGNAPAYFG